MERGREWGVKGRGRIMRREGERERELGDKEKGRERTQKERGRERKERRGREEKKEKVREK